MSSPKIADRRCCELRCYPVWSYCYGWVRRLVCHICGAEYEGFVEEGTDEAAI